MQNISQEYIGAIVIIIVSILKAFGIDIGNDVITSILTGFVAIYIAYRRFQKKDITPLGVRK